MSKFIKLDSRVQNLGFSEPWKALTEQEKNYAYYMAMASWEGSKMVPYQISYESPALFCIFLAFFEDKNFEELEQCALKAGVSAAEWRNFLAYVGGFYGNMSNYHSFGGTKFVPDLSPEVFRRILESNPKISDPNSMYCELLVRVYPLVEKEIFAYDAPYNQINFPSEGGVTAYFSRNMTKADLDLVSEFLVSEKIDILNTRAFKSDENSNQFMITVGSIDTKASRTVTYKGKQFDVVYGEFAEFLTTMNKYLERAKEYAANPGQREMIEKYIEHYISGDIETHKDSQRKWIKDLGPVVETNMGWIETYIDPENKRAYFEGWAAIVDKEKSKKFKSLVENSEKVIPKLPWPKEMEKDNFLAPDFTTLEIIAFATNSCPLGINVPNYDDIRDNEGFKNVFLNNSLGSYVLGQMQFATQEQQEILAANTIKSYEVHVACHELLGHGVGKLIYRNADGSAATFTDPVTGETFESCYEKDETWNGKFGSISASYEECRADTCGFYLAQFPEVYTLFGFQEADIPQLLWVNVMNQMRKGVCGLNLYNPDTQKWGQAHTQGAFVLAMYLYKNQKSEMLKFELIDGGNDMRIHLDQDLLMSEGMPMIKEFLIIIQTYKSSGCVERGKAFYDKYSAVDQLFLDIRTVIIKNKKARRIELNNNLVRYNQANVDVLTYPETFEGIIASYADRFSAKRPELEARLKIWDHTRKYLRVKL